MPYYCGNCLRKKKGLVRTKTTPYGLVFRQMCPKCKETDALTTTEVRALLRLYGGTRKRVEKRAQ